MCKKRVLNALSFAIGDCWKGNTFPSKSAEKVHQKIKTPQAENDVARLPAKSLCERLRDGLGGKLLGNGREQNTPPHGEGIKRHGDHAEDDRNDDLVARFHKKIPSMPDSFH